MTKGIYPNAVPVDQALVDGLRSNHMLDLLPVPKTIMATVLPPHEPWLRVDSTYPSKMRQRFCILAQHYDKVIERVDEPLVRDAEVELRDTVVKYLTTSYPDYFRQRGDVVSSPLIGVAVNLAQAEPMAAVAALSCEDHLLIMAAEKKDEKLHVYRLKSGALLFPNEWSLRSHFNEPRPDGDSYAWELSKQGSEQAARLGRTVAEIHKGIVPHYDKFFVDKVDLMFNTMRAERPIWRRNWAVTLENNLFLHPDVAQPSLPTLTPESMVEQGVVRSEHEGFLRLPKTQAIVFTINTYMWPLREMLAEPTVFNALATARANMSEEMLDYRSRRRTAGVLDVVLANYPGPAGANRPTNVNMPK